VFLVSLRGFYFQLSPFVPFRVNNLSLYGRRKVVFFTTQPPSFRLFLTRNVPLCQGSLCTHPDSLRWLRSIPECAAIVQHGFFSFPFCAMAGIDGFICFLFKPSLFLRNPTFPPYECPSPSVPMDLILQSPRFAHFKTVASSASYVRRFLGSPFAHPFLPPLYSQPSVRGDVPCSNLLDVFMPLT